MNGPQQSNTPAPATQINAISRIALALGALYGFLAVGAGAFGAHALKERLDAYSLDIWNTAAHYQLAHALALVLVGCLSIQSNRVRLLTACTWCYTLGVLIFSGTLYALALSGIKWLGAITPLGGLLLLAGWLCLLAFAIRATKR